MPNRCDYFSFFIGKIVALSLRFCYTILTTKSLDLNNFILGILNMNKLKLLSVLTLSTVVLGACSLLPNNSSNSTSGTEQVETSSKEDTAKEKVTKDATVLLDSILTQDDTKFKKVYGETYEKWSDAIIAVQTSEKIKEDGLTPAAAYSVQWVKEFQVETPEETVSGYFKIRRGLIKKIDNYEIKDVKLDESGNSATVTFTSKKLHSLGLASAVRTVLTELIGGIDNLGKYNTAGSNVDIKKYQTILSYWIFRHLYHNDFNIYSNVDAKLASTPYTTNEYDTEVNLTKDKEGNWQISQDDYKTLLSELLDRSEGYSSISYDKPTKKSDSLKDESKEEFSKTKSTMSEKTDKKSDTSDKSTKSNI